MRPRASTALLSRSYSMMSAAVTSSGASERDIKIATADRRGWRTLDVAVAVDHALIREDPIGGDEIVDELRGGRAGRRFRSPPRRIHGRRWRRGPLRGAGWTWLASDASSAPRRLDSSDGRRPARRPNDRSGSAAVVIGCPTSAVLRRAPRAGLAVQLVEEVGDSGSTPTCTASSSRRDSTPTARSDTG